MLNKLDLYEKDTFLPPGKVRLYFYLFIFKGITYYVAWSDFLIFITRVDIADGIINASEYNRDCSEPVASTNLDNEVIPGKILYLRMKKTNQVKKCRHLKSLC